MSMVKMTDSLTGQVINVHVDDKKLNKLSKNKKRKLKRYGLKFNARQETKGKVYGIIQDYYNYFDSHKICRNPRTILIEQGL